VKGRSNRGNSEPIGLSIGRRYPVHFRIFTRDLEICVALKQGDYQRTYLTIYVIRWIVLSIVVKQRIELMVDAAMLNARRRA